MNPQESLTLSFQVQSFRRIPNPYLKSEEGERTRKCTSQSAM